MVDSQFLLNFTVTFGQHLSGDGHEVLHRPPHVGRIILNHRWKFGTEKVEKAERGGKSFLSHG